MVGRTPAAEDEPVVGRPLSVNDEVPQVTEGLALREPDLGPQVGPERASSMVPPTAMSASMPSTPATRTTSCSVSRIAAYIPTAAACPCSRASAAGLTGKSAEHQPPLRPEAPYPAISDSITATFNDGSAPSR
jgi:hypothetical protein